MPPGDIWRCQKILLIAGAEWRYWHLVGRSQRYCKTSYNPKQPPTTTTTKSSDQNVIGPLLINPALNVILYKIYISAATLRSELVYLSLFIYLQSQYAENAHQFLHFSPRTNDVQQLVEVFQEMCPKHNSTP